MEKLNLKRIIIIGLISISILTIVPIKAFSSSKTNKDIAEDCIKSQNKIQKESSTYDVSNSGSYTPEYKFTDQEIESAMKVAKTYYNKINISDDIKSIEYNLSSDVYGGAFGSLEEYKNSNSIIFLAITKDDNIPRIVVLTRKDKNSDWGVVNEGY